MTKAIRKGTSEEIEVRSMHTPFNLEVPDLNGNEKY
jgi:hypothetical protein